MESSKPEGAGVPFENLEVAMSKPKQPIVSKPLGDSETHDWTHKSIPFGVVLGACTCGFCGTELPSLLEDEDVDNRDEEDEQYHVLELLGREIVLECCGGVLLDHLYKKLGAAFCHLHIAGAAKDPTGTDFHYLLMILGSGLEGASKLLQKTNQQVAETQQAIAGVQRQVKEASTQS